MSHRELGAKILKRLTEELAEFGDIEVAPKMEGYQMFTILAPKKSKTPGAKHTSVAPNKEEEPEKPRREQRQQQAETPKAEPGSGDDEIF